MTFTTRPSEERVLDRVVARLALHVGHLDLGQPRGDVDGDDASLVQPYSAGRVLPEDLSGLLGLVRLMMQRDLEPLVPDVGDGELFLLGDDVGHRDSPRAAERVLDPSEGVPPRDACEHDEQQREQPGPDGAPAGRRVGVAIGGATSRRRAARRHDRRRRIRERGPREDGRRGVRGLGRDAGALWRTGRARRPSPRRSGSGRPGSSRERGERSCPGPAGCRAAPARAAGGVSDRCFIAISTGESPVKGTVPVSIS